MSDQRIPGGFAGDPGGALLAAGAGGCCGTPSPAAPQLLEPGSAPCCGTAAEAKTQDSCCGNTAKTDAVAAGQACCG